MSGDWERCRSLYDRAVSCGASSRAMAKVLPFAAARARWARRPRPSSRRGRCARPHRRAAIGIRVARSEALHVRIGAQVQHGDPHFRETLDRMIEMESIVTDAGSRWSIVYMTAAREHIDGDLVGVGGDRRARASVLAATASPTPAASPRTARSSSRSAPTRVGSRSSSRCSRSSSTDQPDVAAWRAVLTGALGAAGDGGDDRAGREFDRRGCRRVRAAAA